MKYNKKILGINFNVFDVIVMLVILMGFFFFTSLTVLLIELFLVFAILLIVFNMVGDVVWKTRKRKNRK